MLLRLLVPDPLSFITHIYNIKTNLLTYDVIYILAIEILTMKLEYLDLFKQIIYFAMQLIRSNAGKFM